MALMMSAGVLTAPLALCPSSSTKGQGLSSLSSDTRFISLQTPRHLKQALSSSPKCSLSSESSRTQGEEVANGGSRRDVLLACLSSAMALPLIGGAEPAMADFCKEFAPTPSGLEFCDAVVGGGIEPQKGMLIKAHYTGRLTSGQVFDSSYGRGKPLVFKVGVGEVIRGWDKGILGGEGIPPMQAGGKRTLRIPADLAYGERGAGCRGGSCLIPPGSTLIFDVEFVGKA